MLKTAARLVFMTGVATITAVVLAAAPASAHFCFKTNLTERAAEAKSGSTAWVSFEELAFEFTGLCPAGIEVLAEAGGVETDTLINTRGTMAGGTLKKGADSGTPSISHLNFEAIDAAFPEAAAACGA